MLETKDVLTSSLSIGETIELSDGITITHESTEKGSVTTFISNIFK